MTGLEKIFGFNNHTNNSPGSSDTVEPAKPSFSDQDIEKMRKEAIQTEMKVNGLTEEAARKKVDALF